MRPTPVRELRPGLWVKDEGRAGETYGGNKIRKLDRLLAEARERRSTDLVTLGAVGSHHVLATALLGAELGLPTHAVLVPQPDDPHVRENAGRTLAACASVTAVGSGAGAALALARRVAALRLSGRRPYAIGIGGSSPTGVLGWVDGALELAEQVRAGALPAPRRIYLPLGSGGTAAGLLAGLALAGLPAEVVAVRVAPRWLANRTRVARLARAALARRGSVAPLGDLRVIEGWLGAGYGRWDARVDEARARAAELGLHLERTYTSKAFGACLEELDRAEGPALFLQTVTTIEPPVPADPLPERIERLLLPSA